jgi:hypothetical protein
MSELSHTPRVCHDVNMNMHKQTIVNARRWNIVVLGILVALMVHLTVGTDALRTEEPWPVLLRDNSADSDPTITLLQQRANGSLEKLVQSAHESEQL